MSSHVTLQPVFIEPTFRHDFLRASRAAALVVFEALVALLLVRWFLGAELRAAFARPPPPPPSPLHALTAGLRLACRGDELLIHGLPGGTAPALNRDGSPVRLRGCEALLRSVNGP
ncbi:entry/fusion IMV membrane protein [Equine molluscum contagiosum-like virus]|nr:entry/fusion IMV membrane protein [Equine molluscum contagiosum-like virus]